MRIAFRALAVLLALLVTGLVALAVMLPRIAGTDAVRRQIEAASVAALGRPLAYDDLSLGLLPPRIELAAPRIAGADASAPPLATARTVKLRIALWPLLGLVVLVDSLEVDGLEIELVRTAEGFDLPVVPAGEPAEAEPAAESSVTLAVRRVLVHDSRVRVIDRRFTPALPVGLEAFELELVGHSPSDPVDLRGGATLVTGGTLTFEGTTTTAGVLELAIALRDAQLAGLAPYAGEGIELGAALSGDLSIRGPAAEPDAVKAELTLAAQHVVSGTTVVEGPVAIRADLAGSWAAPSGQLAIDAGAARITSGESFVKPPGVALEISGPFSSGADGGIDWTLERLVLATLVAKGRVRIAETTSLELDAAPCDLAGLAALSPAAEGLAVGGELSLERFRAKLEPLSLKGAIRLAGVRLGLEGGGRVDFDGRLVGKADGFDLVDAVVSIGGQRLALSGQARDLLGDVPFSLKLRSEGVLDGNALIGGFDPSLANTLHGPLTISTDLAGRVGTGESESELLDSLTGVVDVDLGRTVGDGTRPGRLVGFSALRAVFGELEQVGEMARITAILLGGQPPDLSAYSTDEIDSLDLLMRVHDGLLDSERFAITYRRTVAKLQGTVRLSDQALNMKGEVALGSDVAALFGAQAKDGEIVVPIARVGGTVAAPQVVVSEKAASALASQLLARNTRVQSLIGGAKSEALKGAPPEVSKTLDILFGGAQKTQPAKPPEQKPAAEPAPAAPTQPAGQP